MFRNLLLEMPIDASLLGGLSLLPLMASLLGCGSRFCVHLFGVLCRFMGNDARSTPDGTEADALWPTRPQ